MKKTTYIYRIALIALFFGASCQSEFLERDPVGVLSPQELRTVKGADQLLIGAYALLDGNYSGNDPWRSSVTNWVYGSICGGDANKGSDPGDAAEIDGIQRFQPNVAGTYFDEKWIALYEGITRANATLRIIAQIEGAPNENIKKLTGEARFLRGFYHFEAKKMWNNIPYLDESVEYAKKNYKIPNTTNIWPKIEEDFNYAYQNLQESGMEIGRANKWAAAAFLAKVYMFQSKFSDAKPLLESIIANGKAPDGESYKLAPQFHYNFNVEHENGKGYDGTESVFAVQASVNDGAGANNSNAGEVLNFPHGGGAETSCCGFFQPSFELVNSYRTNSQGLPLLDGSYNSSSQSVTTDQRIKSDDTFTPDQGNLDPRLDWTVGRRGIPYLDWGIHPGKNWIRNEAWHAGPYSPKKHVFYKSQVAQFTDGSSWTKGYTALNYVLIRYADVLLWAAECETEIGSLDKARQYVNQIRTRAANSAGFVQNNGGAAANYVISEYPSGSSAFSSKEAARQTVHFERKLELAMEGHRFFDLVRWGEAEKTLNAYLQYESTILQTYFGGAKFTAPKNNYFPIPQRQIDLTGADVLKQNTGY